MSRKPTAKQETFVAELVKNGGNATAAAQVAYPNATGIEITFKNLGGTK